MTILNLHRETDHGGSVIRGAAPGVIDVERRDLGEPQVPSAERTTQTLVVMKHAPRNTDVDCRPAAKPGPAGLGFEG